VACLATTALIGPTSDVRVRLTSLKAVACLATTGALVGPTSDVRARLNLKAVAWVQPGGAHDDVTLV
jgi:hypothetical protein